MIKSISGDYSKESLINPCPPFHPDVRLSAERGASQAEAKKAQNFQDYLRKHQGRIPDYQLQLYQELKVF